LDDGCIYVRDSWNMWGRVCLKFVGVCNEFNSYLMGYVISYEYNIETLVMNRL